MSQCVPNWDLSDPPPSCGRPPFHSHSSSAVHDFVPMLECEVAELTWENGQLAMHGLRQPRLPGKVQLGGGGSGSGGGGGSKYTWDNKPARASGTLESLVNQGTGHPDRKIVGYDVGTDGGDLVPWFADHHRATAAASAAAAATPAGSAATTMDALVPCDAVAAVDSNDFPVAALEEEDEDCRLLHGKRARGVARVVPTRDSRQRQVSLDTCGRDFSVGSGFTTTAATATSQGSLENTSSGKPCMKTTTTTTTTDYHDSVCHSTPQEEDDEADRKKENAKSSGSTKRSRAAAIHNQSERKRRDKINQRMRTLQKLVPNSNKTDKASMLDEVIEYLKQLQAQVTMMSRMNMPGMMLPMAMQQLPMASLMGPMSLGMGMPGMGMGMGLGMDHLNMLAGRPGLAAGMSPLLHPAAFMPVAAWDGGTCDQLQHSPTMMMADPLSTFLACQSQPMTVEAYNRIATMFQQFHQQSPSTGGSKN